MPESESIIATRGVARSRRSRTAARRAPLLATLVALRAARVVLAYWGWQLFGPAPLHVPPAAPRRSGGGDPRFGPVRRRRRAARRGAATRDRDARAATCGCSACSPKPTARGYALFRLPTRSEARRAGQRDRARRDARRRAAATAITIRDGGGERRIALRGDAAAAGRAAAPRRAMATGRARRARAVRACAPPRGISRAPSCGSTPNCWAASSRSRTAGARCSSPVDGALVVRDDSGFVAMLGDEEGRPARRRPTASRSRRPTTSSARVLRPLAAKQARAADRHARRRAARMWLAQRRRAPADRAPLSARAERVSAAAPAASRAGRAARRSSRSPASRRRIAAVAEIAVARDDRRHAGRVAGLDVAQVVADVDAVRRRRRRAALAACSSGAGCGFGCGVVSPRHDRARARREAERVDDRRA